jgi:hypothetical protein
VKGFNEILSMEISSTLSLTFMEETIISHTLLPFVSYLNRGKLPFCVYTRSRYWSVFGGWSWKICNFYESRKDNVTLEYVSGPWAETNISKPTSWEWYSTPKILLAEVRCLSAHCYERLSVILATSFIVYANLRAVFKPVDCGGRYLISGEFVWDSLALVFATVAHCSASATSHEVLSWRC